MQKVCCKARFELFRRFSAQASKKWNKSRMNSTLKAVFFFKIKCVMVNIKVVVWTFVLTSSVLDIGNVTIFKFSFERVETNTTVNFEAETNVSGFPCKMTI